MAIKELIPNKKYLVRVYFRDTFGDSKELRKTVNGSKTAAKLIESELIMQTKSTDFDRHTFNDVFKLYLKSKTNVQDDTKRKYTEMFERSLSGLSKTRMANLKPIDYMNIRNEIEATESSWTQKNKTIYLMKSISKFAYEYLNVKDNARMIKAIPKDRAVAPKYHTLTIEEFEEIMIYEQNYTYYVMFNLIYWAGLRKSEARLLRKTDVKNNGIDVTDEHRTLKNRSSSRFIPLDDKTYDLVSELAKNGGEWLFGDEYPIPDTNINRHLKNCIDRANIIRERKGLSAIPHIRVHDLRHSHATLLIENGENIKAVSERLGHSSTTETQKTYIHLYKDADKRVAENINKLRK